MMAHAPPTTRPAAAADAALPLVEDELDVLAQLLPLERQRIIELGCGDARLVRALLRRWPSCRVAALETVCAWPFIFEAEPSTLAMDEDISSVAALIEPAWEVIFFAPAASSVEMADTSSAI